MCVHPVSEWSVFLPFSVNCSQVAMFQIMPALCPHGQGGGGGVQPIQPNVDRPGQRDGGPKNSQICADVLYGWPHIWIWLGNNGDTYSKFRRKLKCARDTFSV